jgi:hypothetical protein
MYQFVLCSSHHNPVGETKGSLTTSFLNRAQEVQNLERHELASRLI